MTELPRNSKSGTSYKADIQFAVFDGSKEITPQIYEEVKNFANFIAQREENKKNVSE